MPASLRKLVLLIVLCLAACTPAAPTESPYLPLVEATPTATAGPTGTPAPTVTSLPPTPPNRAALWVQPELPQPFKDAVRLPAQVTQVDNSTEANLRLEVGEDNPVTRWVFAFVAPFPEITDNVAFEDVLHLWTGNGSVAIERGTLYVDQATYDLLSIAWGQPASAHVKVSAADKLVDTAWANRPSWAIVPFEQVEPRWKVLSVEGQSPLQKEFDLATYPLTVSISLNGSPDFEMISDSLSLSLPWSNRDPQKLTTVVLTGVTALVRATSNKMYAKGNTYPAEDIRPWLADADILHVSNEVPFAEKCPIYIEQQTELVFCTNPRYIELLEYIGTDVVELTGDHFADWGPEATLYTLELYKERGWPYYGGGANLQEAQQPVLFEHNGNKIAFIGCNAKGGGYATADEDTPGAGECDYEYMTREIRKLVSDGYLVIATMQHQEYYTYEVRHPYEEDFLALSDAGAVIVSGSQAHLPQAMTFNGDRFIHFGLGNLFFDQYNIFPQTNDAFIDRHVFYDGRYLGVELLTTRFIDFARSRPMTAEERSALLQTIFKASGW